MLWWYRIIPYRSYVKGWKISPSHYLNQDLSTVKMRAATADPRAQFRTLLIQRSPVRTALARPVPLSIEFHPTLDTLVRRVHTLDASSCASVHNVGPPADAVPSGVWLELKVA
jgi:hypothetical protein